MGFMLVVITIFVPYDLILKNYIFLPQYVCVCVFVYERAICERHMEVRGQLTEIVLFVFFFITCVSNFCFQAWEEVTLPTNHLESWEQMPLLAELSRM